MRVARVLVCFIFFMSDIARADVISSMIDHESNGNEFFVGKELGRPLITINMVSGVNRPGVYHVPVDTNLAQVLAYAGGTTERSDLGDVSIFRTTKNEHRLVPVNFDNIIKDSSSFPAVQDQDVIHIPQKTSFESTLRWTTLISSIVSIAMSIAVINDLSRRKNN